VYNLPKTWPVGRTHHCHPG